VFFFISKSGKTNYFKTFIYRFDSAAFYNVKLVNASITIVLKVQDV